MFFYKMLPTISAKKRTLNCIPQNPHVTIQWIKTNIETWKQLTITGYYYLSDNQEPPPHPPGGVLPYSFCVGVPLGSRKSYPLQKKILQILRPYTRGPILIPNPTAD